MVADLPNVDCCEAPEVSRDVNEAPLLDFGLSIAPDLMALRPPTPPPNLGRGGGGGEQSGGGAPILPRPLRPGWVPGLSRARSPLTCLSRLS